MFWISIGWLVFGAIIVFLGFKILHTGMKENDDV